MAIFIAVVVIVSGFLVYDSRMIAEIDSDVVMTDEVKGSVQEKQVANVQITQEKIDVLADADLESDGEDLLGDEIVDFSDVEELVVEEVITF